jgi:hypothetical protein
MYFGIRIGERPSVDSLCKEEADLGESASIQALENLTIQKGAGHPVLGISYLLGFLNQIDCSCLFTRYGQMKT